MRRVALTLAGLVTLAGCGGGGSVGAPSVVAVPDPQPTPYAYTFERWQVGLPMKHCFAGDIDQSVARWAAAEMARATGIPQTEEGACNVWWVVDRKELHGLRSADDQRALCVPYYKQGTLARNGARLVFEDGGALAVSGVHEGGHALGLGHSTDPGDVMFPRSTAVRTWSAGEMARLAEMYRVK